MPSLEGQDGRQQYLVLAELCNECGNCLTFCPEDGDPAEIKPRLHVDADVFAARDGQGFLLTAGNDGQLTVTSRTGDDASAEVVHDLLTSTGGNPLVVKGPT